MFTRPRKKVTSKMQGASKTQKHLAKMCDINNMVARALRGDNSVFRSGGQYLDISEAPSNLQDALNVSIDARNVFEALPEDIKQRYLTPEAFVNASVDPTQREYFEAAGLCHKAQKIEPIQVTVVNPSPVKGDANVPASVVL